MILSRIKTSSSAEYLDPAVVAKSSHRQFDEQQLVHETELSKPVPCLLCFLSANLDSQTKIFSAQTVVGFDVVRSYGSRSFDQLSTIVHHQMGTRKLPYKSSDPSGKSEGSLFEIVDSRLFAHTTAHLIITRDSWKLREFVLRISGLVLPAERQRSESTD